MIEFILDSPYRTRVEPASYDEAESDERMRVVNAQAHSRRGERTVRVDVVLHSPLKDREEAEAEGQATESSLAQAWDFLALEKKGA